MITSEFLYIEQLYEVLKHLFVIFVQVCILFMHIIHRSNTVAFVETN
jgi:hypothetical protein